MEKRTVLFLALYCCFFQGRLVPLTSEQLTFIQTYQPPPPLRQQCDLLFNHLILYQKSQERKCSEKSLLDYLHLAKFTLLKTDRGNKTKKYAGDLKIIAEHPMISGYILKMQFPLPSPKPPSRRTQYNMSRVHGAEILRSALKNSNCTSIIIPQKYLYHLPGAPLELEDQHYIVLSEKLPIIELKLSTLDHAFHANKERFINDLKKLIEKTGYYDAKPENIYLTDNNRIAIIDTELLREHWTPLRPFSWIKGIRLWIETILGKMNLSKLDK